MLERTISHLIKNGYNIKFTSYAPSNSFQIKVKKLNTSAYSFLNFEDVYLSGGSGSATVAFEKRFESELLSLAEQVRSKLYDGGSSNAEN